MSFRQSGATRNLNIKEHRFLLARTLLVRNDISFLFTTNLQSKMYKNEFFCQFFAKKKLPDWTALILYLTIIDLFISPLSVSIFK